MATNLQSPEKLDRTGDGRVLDVHSIFPTIQGEGPFAGEPATFIRLAGCNLQCPRCDTIYTHGRKLTAIGEILRHVRNMTAPNHLVVITGGEPFRQPLDRLVDELLKDGYRVQIETNGSFYRALPYRNPNLTIVCSPKTGAINASLRPHIDALKYVMHADSIAADGLPILALDHPAGGGVARRSPGDNTRIYLQPIDVGDPVENARHLEAVKRSCLTHGYTLCLQQHKIINVE